MRNLLILVVIRRSTRFRYRDYCDGNVEREESNLLGYLLAAAAGFIALVVEPAAIACVSHHAADTKIWSLPVVTTSSIPRRSDQRLSAMSRLLNQAFGVQPLSSLAFLVLWGFHDFAIFKLL